MADRVWSPYQQAIFREVAEGTGNVVVCALAGSGKTSTIIESMKLTAGKRVLAVAFNKSIATELASRVPPNVEVKTLHSLGYACVRNAWGRATQMDDKRDSRIAKEVLPDGSKWEDIMVLCKLVGLAKNLLVETADDLEALAIDQDISSKNLEPMALACFAVDALKLAAVNDGTISFDDMVWLPVKLGLPVPTWDLVFVDETQDMNKPQLWLAQQAGKGGRIVAVGDRWQSIYQFRGADTEAIPRMIVELSAKVLPLSITYRCPRSVVRMAQEYVPALEAWAGASEGTINECSEQGLDPKPGDFVLSRVNAPLMSIALDLLRRGVPCRIQGQDVGKSLIQFVERFKVVQVDDLIESLQVYRSKELKKLMRAQASEKQIENLYDRVNTIVALTDGVDTVPQLITRISSLFREGVNQVVCSSTHKAKGLEADRVWLLADTYLRWPGQEEANLWYVALTRCKKDLVLVSGFVKKLKEERDDA